MREGKWLHLLLVGLLACTLALAGCAGDDGSDGVSGQDGKNGQDFQLPQGNAGLFNCSTCHGSGSAAQEWAASGHANQGSHVSSCAVACHDPLGDAKEMDEAFGVSKSYVVSCEACHGGGAGHNGIGPIPVAAPGTAVCGTCHDGAEHIKYHPYYAQIASRFETSRHATGGARAALCSACHSHEGGIEFLAMGRKTTLAALETAYTADTVAAYSLPVGSSTIVGVMKKTCATCHDPHTAGLRGDGDIKDADSSVMFSAEFNLCTACHMVDLTATYAAHADAGNLYSYQLSDKYTAANLIDATTQTYDFTKKAFYHDGASGNGRTMVDTHFAGTILKHLVDFDGSATDVVVKGYNINAGSKNACTICHDPHTAGKMLSIDSSSTIDYADQLDNKAISYAEGLGDFHTNYLGAAQGHGCLPCHSGDALVPVTLGAALPSGNGTSAIGCRTCHDLAVANATAGTNNAAAFAKVRELPADYEFKFNSGAVAAVADLGVNQICFECHKGRTPAMTQTAFDALADDVKGTTNNKVAYLHYAPSMAILFGSESQMAATYPTKSYAGKFVHGGGPVGGVTEFGCVDCHNVHDTNGNHAVASVMTTSTSCKGCHEAGAFADAADLQARTQAYSERLLATIYDKMAEAYALKASNNARFLQFYAGADGNDAGTELDLIDATNLPGVTGLQSMLEYLFEGLAGDRTAQDEALMKYIGLRNAYFPSKAVAKAAAGAWKVFTYEDGSPHGQTHGHGGSWAHNSKFARQVMYDAIENLGGSLTGLTRP